MELIAFLGQHWLICSSYFFVGFTGFYLTCLRYKRRYGIGSVNGFWGDLFVASMWGMFWSIFLVAYPVAWTFKELEKRTGVYINISSLCGVLVCSVLMVTKFAELARKLAYHNFSGVGTNLLLLLLFSFFFYIALKTINQRSSLPNWVQKSIDNDLAKWECAKKNAGTS